jgi:ceramide glucosyltransferase
VGSALDNMSINAFSAASSATAEALLKMTQLVGKSFAVKREILVELGGWEAVKDLLAEDQRFGTLLRQSGHKTRLCPTPVANVQQTAPFAHFWQRHSRWSMLRFMLLPGAWAEPLQLPFIWALGAALASPASPFMWWFFAASSVLTIAFTQGATWLLRGQAFSLRWAWLIPVRDFAFLAAWARGMTMRTVTWRGNRLEVVKNTYLQAAPLAPKPVTQRDSIAAEESAPRSE